MNRRLFLAALGIVPPALAAPRRVYSFLWDNPLVAVPAQRVDVELIEYSIELGDGRVFSGSAPRGVAWIGPRLPAGAHVARVTANVPGGLTIGGGSEQAESAERWLREQGAMR